MAGPVGFHRKHEPAAGGFIRHCGVLLLQVRMGMGCVRIRGKYRKRTEAAELDEADLQVFRACLRPGPVYIRTCHIRLALNRLDI